MLGCADVDFEQHIAQQLILIVNLPKDKKRFEYYSENNKMLI
jgi:hypothetical protein